MNTNCRGKNSGWEHYRWNSDTENTVSGTLCRDSIKTGTVKHSEKKFRKQTLIKTATLDGLTVWILCTVPIIMVYKNGESDATNRQESIRTSIDMAKQALRRLKAKRLKGWYESGVTLSRLLLKKNKQSGVVHGGIHSTVVAYCNCRSTGWVMVLHLGCGSYQNSSH